VENQDGSNDSDEDQHSNQIKFKELSQISPQLLENVAQDFTINYRARTEIIIKEIRQSIQNHVTINSIKERFLRMLMLQYSAFIELIKAVHPKYHKEIPTAHMVLLELKNLTPGDQ